MVAIDEAALICDMAETYRIYDYRALPARRAALYACGLRADSRIMMRIAGARAPVNTLLLGAIADALKILVWQNTRDGSKGRNRPESILDGLLGRTKEKETEGVGTVEDFRVWRDSMLGGGGGG